ncbi:MAG: hypothetical protein HUU50_02795 [Candidatus Brocadiae bacterium]|nr:hypothetical protein [Candidatus Brocadiia bacterium]
MAIRKTYPDEFKAQVAMEALKEQKTLEEIGSLSRFQQCRLPNGKSMLKIILRKSSVTAKVQNQNNRRF